jgi:asparagine synthase (glutamine-hydrolysing)
MCGIWAYLGDSYDSEYEDLIYKLIPRGPEGMRVVPVNDSLTFGFTRLAINGLTDSGMQPFVNGPITWMCNGEIYNYRDIQRDLHLKSNDSDCHCIGEVYLRHRENPETFLRTLDGVFGLVLYDSELSRLIVARDPYGIRPVFVGVNDSGTFIASEMKALPSCYSVRPVLPGSYEIYDMNTRELVKTAKYHTIPWVISPIYNPDDSMTARQDASTHLRIALEEAVRKRMLAERPVAALLSGGLDSSLIAALVQTHLSNVGAPPLKTFAIGFEGSSDLKHARIAADWIQTDHTEIVMTPDEFFNAIPRVIHAIESYDRTTVRASVGNYLVAKYISENTDCKVVFNGDGSDEIFGGYLYFNNAPNNMDFQQETERLLENIHTFDVLRSDRSISANGLEPRTPFLDKQFVALVRSIHPSFLRPCPGIQVEKAILREAFDDGVTLPPEVINRRKEAFSDGVSGTDKSWYQEIRDRVAKLVPDDWQDEVAHLTHMRPLTAEDFYYRQLFETFYPGDENALATVPYRWMPRWSPETTDPSARTLNVYTV